MKCVKCKCNLTPCHCVVTVHNVSACKTLNAFVRQLKLFHTINCSLTLQTLIDKKTGKEILLFEEPISSRNPYNFLKVYSII